jgi:hypothetical protein
MMRNALFAARLFALAQAGAADGQWALEKSTLT